MDDSGHCSSECHHLKVLEARLEEKEVQLLELQNQLSTVQEKCLQYQKDCERLSEELQTEKLDLRDRIRLSRDGQSQTNEEIIDEVTLCKCKTLSSVEANTQTFESDFNNDNSTGSAIDWKPDIGSEKSVADIVTDTVSNFVSNDYIYEETSGTYYHTTTGYYYDPYNKLFFEPNTRTYYSYDENNKSYEFHSQLKDETTATTKKDTKSSKSSHSKKHKKSSRNSKSKDRESSSKRNSKKKSKKRRDSERSHRKKRSRRYSSSDETRSSLEDGEVDSDTSSVVLIESDTSGGCEIIENDPDSYPPSMRLIVKSSETLQFGTLLLVTYKGGLVGRTEQFEICIPDTNISRSHAKIEYDESAKEYRVSDLGSQNGTFVNEIRLSQPKVVSESKPVAHGDLLTFGSCVLVAHIHSGNNTCDNCEPGILQTASKNEVECISEPIKILTKAERELERKRQMKLLKKKYALESAEFETAHSAKIDKIGYKDRAENRRKTVGSSNPYEKDAEGASLDKPIEVDNKGYKMLEKLGWSTGQSLGQSKDGILEPINPAVQFDRTGFGKRGFNS